MNAEFLSFDRSALLLIDFQYSFSAEGDFKTDAWETIVSNASKLLAACRENKIPVIFVCMWRRPDGSDAHPKDPRDEAGRPLYAVAGTAGAEIVEKLRPKEGEIIIKKQRFSAFFQTNLELTLHGLQIGHLIISGVSTDQCILTTVYDAHFRDYEITVVKDACGTSSRAAHMTSVLDMANWVYGCSVFVTDELVKAIRGETFRAWFWERPGSYLYSVETIEDMYRRI